MTQEQAAEVLQEMIKERQQAALNYNMKKLPKEEKAEAVARFRREIEAIQTILYGDQHERKRP